MPRAKRDLVRANFYLQPNVVKGLRILAALKATTVSDLVRQALRQYVLDEMTKEKKHDADPAGIGLGAGSAGTAASDFSADN